MGLIEKIAHKLPRRRHEIVPCRTVHRQRALAFFKPGRKHQSRKIAAVVDVEVTEQNNIQLGHLRSALSEAQGAASTGINENARGAAIPYEIAGGGSLILQLRAAGAEHLNRHSRG